jgi:hypothetical protein
MVQRAMQKEPQTIAAKFNSIFTTKVLVAIIGGLLGLVTMRLMGL